MGAASKAAALGKRLLDPPSDPEFAATRIPLGAGVAVGGQVAKSELEAEAAERSVDAERVRQLRASFEEVALGLFSEEEAGR